jgi:hypothetical protein
LKRKAPPHAWKAGQSGNPGGRPKSNLSKLLAEYGQGKDPGDRITREKKLVAKVWKLALDGDESCRDLIFDRLAPKPPQEVDLASGGLPVAFTLSLGDGAQPGDGEQA